MLDYKKNDTVLVPTIVKRTRFNQTTELYQPKEVPAKPGIKPHSTVKQLPTLPIREHQQDNMLQRQDNMLQDEEVVDFGQRVQQPQHQQQLQQYNIPHNPVVPKQVMSPNRPNVEAPNMVAPPGPNALYQHNNLVQQIVRLEWDQKLREIVHGNNDSIEHIIAEVQRIKQAMGHITNGLNDAFGQVRTDAQNHRCKKIEVESVKSERKWPAIHEQLQKIPELERELRASKEKIEALERKLVERDGSPRANSQQLVEKVALMDKRLKEGGLSTEQSGHHELIREIHRLQLWIQSLNGGWVSNAHPETWTSPTPALEKRCTQLQAQYERAQAELQRVQFNRTQFNPVQSNRTQFDSVQFDRTQLDSVQSIRTQSNQVQSNRTQFDQVQSDRSQLHSQSMDSSPFGSNPTDSNPMGSDQISFNRDGLNAMPSNPVQSNARTPIKCHPWTECSSA